MLYIILIFRQGLPMSFMCQGAFACKRLFINQTAVFFIMTVQVMTSAFVCTFVMSTVGLHLVVSKAQKLLANERVLGFHFRHMSSKRNYFE
jgi:hypothetical protein